MTDAELLDAAAVHCPRATGLLYTHPSLLYVRGRRRGGGVCFFGYQNDNGDHGWKVATGNEPIVVAGAGDGVVVFGWKVTLAFDDDGRCAALGRAARWAMDEFVSGYLEDGRPAAVPPAPARRAAGGGRPAAARRRPVPEDQLARRLIVIDPWRS
ncbi:hypothetical protein ACP4OV_018382 [Aristida adscensionis]